MTEALFPYVVIPVAARCTGLSVAAIEKKIAAGHWLEGREYRRGPDGEPEISVEGFARWVESGPVPTSPLRAACQPVRTALYRHFSANGALLYVGISLSPIMRLAAHKASSGWHQEIAQVSVEWFASREAALAAERAAIKAERPQHNIVHAEQ